MSLISTGSISLDSTFKECSVSDPDPEPAFPSDADPDPTFQFDAYPDPDPASQKMTRIRIHSTATLDSKLDDSQVAQNPEQSRSQVVRPNEQVIHFNL